MCNHKKHRNSYTQGWWAGAFKIRLAPAQEKTPLLLIHLVFFVLSLSFELKKDFSIKNFKILTRFARMSIFIHLAIRNTIPLKLTFSVTYLSMLLGVQGCIYRTSKDINMKILTPQFELKHHVLWSLKSVRGSIYISSLGRRILSTPFSITGE